MKKLILLSLFALFVIPNGAHAYVTFDQSAREVNEQTGLFYIDFAFGHANKPIYIPVQAMRSEDAVAANMLSYELFDNGETVTRRGETTGLVLSTADIVDSYYYIPAGEQANFRLAIILTTESDTPETDYTLGVTHLPFLLGEDMREQELNPSELSYYMTPQIELNTDNSPRIEVTVTDIEYSVVE